MPAQTLRYYQSRGRNSIWGAWKRGARRVLAVSPTGSGKTTLFSYIVDETLRTLAGSSAITLVHRRELAKQAANRFREFGVDFGLVMAKEPGKPYARAQIASIQTLAKRGTQFKDVRLIVIDEAHLSTAATYAKILERFPDALILGVTATPWRLSGKPLASLYDEVIVVATPRELREQGHLCDYTGFSYKTPDLTGVSIVGDDYNAQQLGERMSAIVPDVVEQWLKHARELSTVVFAATVEHSQKLVTEFRAAGIAAEHLDGTTSQAQRDAILERVDRGLTRVLCNVGIAVEGLDIPRLKCCVDVAPTLSLARCIQKYGRVRRPWNGVTARIHDHAFNIRTHGLPDADRDYALNAKAEKPPSLTTCSECLALYAGPQCPACSHVNEPAPATERELQEIHDAEQVAFDSNTETPAPVTTRFVTVSWDNSRRDKTLEGVFCGRDEEKTKFGRRALYFVEKRRPHGHTTRYALPGTNELDRKLAVIREGDTVQVTYLGERLLENSTKSLKSFRVAYDRKAAA